jgi:glycosyltransferase involved in cell wall biosynthesis
MTESATGFPVPVSVIIPAHDEASVIGRCLATLLAGAHPGELEIVVVCNGCSDHTAAVARAHAPMATVRELAAASKPAALNAGDQLATRFPRFYLDADVELPVSVLREMARPLAEQRYAYAAPTARFVARRRSPAVRAYLQVWNAVSRTRDEPAGRGVYGLSAGGRARFDAFPDLVADDQFVVQQLHPRERLALTDGYATIHPPLTLGALTRTRVRVYRGNRQLARSDLARHPAARGAVSALVALARHPRHLPAVGVYVAVNVLARLLARAPYDDAWTRDGASRLAPAEGLRTA